MSRSTAYDLKPETRGPGGCRFAPGYCQIQTGKHLGQIVNKKGRNQGREDNSQPQGKIKRQNHQGDFHRMDGNDGGFLGVDLPVRVYHVVRSLQTKSNNVPRA